MAGGKRRALCTDMNTLAHADTGRSWAPTTLPQDGLSWSLAEGAPRRTHAALSRAFQGACVSRLQGHQPHFQSQPQISADGGQRLWCGWKEGGGQGPGLVPRPGRSWGVKAIGRGWPRRIWRLRGHWRQWLSWEAWELRLCWIGRFAS